MQKSQRLRIILILATSLIGWVQAKDWWENKHYLDWSKKEVKQMLDRSPWGKIHTITIINPMYTGERTFQSTGSGDLEREKQNHFHIRFLTASPIRMALARNMILNSKNQLDAGQLRSMVETSDDQNIVITISLSAEPAGADSIRAYWSSLFNARTPDLAKDTFLATKTGKRVYLARYEPPGEDGLGARLLFPRNLPDGSPFVTAADRELRFETMLTLDTLDIQAPGARQVRTDRIFANFKLEKMVFQGRLEF